MFQWRESDLLQKRRTAATLPLRKFRRVGKKDFKRVLLRCLYYKYHIERVAVAQFDNLLKLILRIRHSGVPQQECGELADLLPLQRWKGRVYKRVPVRTALSWNRSLPDEDDYWVELALYLIDYGLHMKLHPAVILQQAAVIVDYQRFPRRD